MPAPPVPELHADTVFLLKCDEYAKNVISPKPELIAASTTPNNLIPRFSNKAGIKKPAIARTTAKITRTGYGK
jgi:hypothetical protein